MEDLVHFFQGPVGSFRIEEVHARNHEGVNNGENDVGPVSDVGEGWRRHHNYHEVENPVCGCGNGVGRSTNTERCDFSGIEPRGC